MIKLSNHKPAKDRQEIKVFSLEDLPKRFINSNWGAVFISDKSGSYLTTMDMKITHAVGVLKGEDFWAALELEEAPTIDELLEVWIKEQNKKDKIKKKSKERKK